jgi:hypothetical protein
MHDVLTTGKWPESSVIEVAVVSPPLRIPSDWTITVTHCGRIYFKGRKVTLSHAIAGQNAGSARWAAAS